MTTPVKLKRTVSSTEKKYYRGFHLFLLVLALQIGFFLSFYGHLDVASWGSTLSLLSSLDSTENAAFHVFWNLYLPKEDDKAEEILQAMREQIHQVARAAHNETVVLHYVSIGNLQMIMPNSAFNTTNNLVTEACAPYKHLVCHHVRHFAKGFEQVTLDVLFDHCVSSTSTDESVAYIHNKGSYHTGSWIDPKSKREMRKDVWRRHGTAGALHPDCRRHTDTCNVCGLLWTPVPWNHAPGNFWTARCSYIRQLVRPSHFDRWHNQLFVHVYKPLVDEGKMVATKQFLMGQDRWSMEMWIGSHPTLRPCDLSIESDIKEWLHTNRINITAPVGMDDGADDIFDWARFPRATHDMRTLFDHSEPRFNPGLLDRPEIRFRDYNMLGGMIMRWRLMYEEMPVDDSWMWEYYPDGKVWQQGLKLHGTEKVYEALSKEYWEPPIDANKAPLPPAPAAPQKPVQQPYNATKCENMSKDGHCQDAEGGAWNYRNVDGTCAHTEHNAPKDGGAVRNLPTIFPDVDVVHGGGVLDFGGGPGIYLTGFRNHVRTNLGIPTNQSLKLLSMEPHPLNECLFEGLRQDTTDLLHAPLTEIPLQEYDLVMTFEVLEHIPVNFHPHLIRALTQMTKKWLIVCAAHPGQPGEGHIGPSMKTRDQWKEEILATVGDVMEYDANKTADLHRIPTWPTIKQNGSVFRRKNVPA